MNIRLMRIHDKMASHQWRRQYTDLSAKQILRNGRRKASLRKPTLRTMGKRRIISTVWKSPSTKHTKNGRVQRSKNWSALNIAEILGTFGHLGGIGDVSSLDWITYSGTPQHRRMGAAIVLIQVTHEGNLTNPVGIRYQVLDFEQKRNQRLMKIKQWSNKRYILKNIQLMSIFCLYYLNDSSNCIVSRIF